MTLLPKVKLKAAVNFPAKVLDGTGIDVTKANGSYRFDLDYGDFAPPVTSLSDPTHQNALLWNSSTNHYDLIPVSILTGSGVFPATAFPLVESGSGAIGGSLKYAREDHVHPVSPPSPFIQSGTGAVTRTAQDKMREIVSVKDFGATGNGIADDTAAIQAAIDSLPATGGDVHFPTGTYKISNTLLIGNSAGTLFSTKTGVHLIGDGSPAMPAGIQTGFTGVGGVKLLWAGLALAMIAVRGPLTGWGVSNMYLDGAGVAARGIDNNSGSFGRADNLSIDGCNQAIRETTIATANAMHNIYTSITINVPAAANALGVFLSGAPPVCNSCYSRFENLIIVQPATLTTYGVYLQWTDSPTFDGVHIWGGSATSVAIAFDYTVQNNMPSGCMLYSIDPSGTGTSTQFANIGTPGTGARPNYLYGMDEINLGTSPNLLNLVPDLPRQFGTRDLLGNTTAIGTTTLFTPFVTGIYRVAYYMVMQVAGTAGTITFNAGYNDGAGARTQSSTAVNANGSAPLFVGGVFAFRASAGAAITYSTTFTAVTGSPSYAVSIAVERVG